LLHIARSFQRVRSTTLLLSVGKTLRHTDYNFRYTLICFPNKCISSLLICCTANVLDEISQTEHLHSTEVVLLSDYLSHESPPAPVALVALLDVSDHGEQHWLASIEKV
jgi:hypothetical protein